MPIPSFVTKQGREPWIVTPASAPLWRRAGEAGWSRLFEREAKMEGKAFPERLFRWEALAAPRAHALEPYSLQWFLAIEHLRHGRHARWIPQLLEFTRHSDESLLGLGHGLGTDWLQYARHGARVIACSPVNAELALMRRNFELRGLSARFLHAEPASLPLADASLDVVCINGLLQETAEPGRLVAEVYRVLKPGGKVLAVVPAKYAVDYFRHRLTPWQSRPVLRDHSPWRAARADGSPVCYSRRRLKRLFHHFADHRIHKRQLRRRELPWLCRWLPVDYLQKLVGRFLILKAFKPISAPLQRASAAA
jgi:SAM-dependent methyltransferase